MKIAIIGAGAMGSLFGGLLSDVSEVCLYSRNKAYVRSVRERGLIMTRGEERMVKQIRAEDDPARIGPVDVAILLVKATGTRAAMEHAMLSAVGPDTIVLPLQNGIGAVDIVKQFVPDSQIAYGFTTLTSDMVEPGHIEMTTRAKVGTYFAPCTGEVSARLAELVALMRQVGLNAEIPADLDETIWYKLMVNTSQNTLCSILRINVSGLVNTPESLKLQNDVVREVAAVARAKGLPITDEQALAHVDHVSQANLGHIPSMVFDVLKKKPTEIANLNEAVVAEGRRLGVPTPINEMIVAMIRTLEKNYDSQVELHAPA